MLSAVHALKAHVKNGRIVVDEPTDLPEGAEVQLYIESIGDDDMSDEERAALEEAIEEGIADADAGRVVDASEFLRQLQARATT